MKSRPLTPQSPHRRCARPCFCEPLEPRILLSVGDFKGIIGTVDNRLLFITEGPNDSRSLYANDGTPAGTSLLAQLPAIPDTGGTPRQTNWSLPLAYFWVGSPDPGTLTLWTTDGTPAGTHPASSKQFTYPTVPRLLPNANRVFFIGEEVGSGLGRELYVSDGTELGTSLVKDINPGPGNGFFTGIGVSDASSTFYFVANDGTTGNELWKTDGTEANTQIVAELDLSNSGGPESLFIANGTLRFTLNNGGAYSLFQSDGTLAGTTELFNIDSLGVDFGGEQWTFLNNQIYFVGYDATNGFRPYVSDGTLLGTSRLNADFQVDGLFEFQSNVYFRASRILPDPAGFTIELWKTDGTAPGTSLVQSFIGRDQDFIAGFSVLYDRLYFFIADNPAGVELWSTDGTPDGTRTDFLLPPLPQLSFPFPLDFASSGSTLFFSAPDSQGRFRLNILNASAPQPQRVSVDDQPDPLFRELYYLQQNPDVAAAINAGLFVSGFQHFLAFGQAEGRSASPLFSESAYLAKYQDVATAVNSGFLTSGYQHFLLYGMREGRNAAPFFNEQYYLGSHPDVALAVAVDQFASGYHHFIQYGFRENRRPSLAFDPQFYLTTYPDIAAAVLNGQLSSAYEHYVLYGITEGRLPRA